MTARQSWPDRLAEVRRLAAGATPGEWDTDGRIVRAPKPHSDMPRRPVVSASIDGDFTFEQNVRNAEFIAAARTAVPELADEVDRLSKEKATVEKRNASQRRELSRYEERVKSRTMELDAMGYVWCDGGCAYGVYQKPGHEHMRPLTREMAIRAMRAAVRIGRKFGSTVEWKEMEESERVCMRAKELAIGFDRCRAESAEAEAARLDGLLAGSRYLASQRAKEIADRDARIAELRKLLERWTTHSVRDCGDDACRIADETLKALEA